MSKSREIKRRIKSVSNISQVTNAMQLVAASRMRKAQENAEKGKFYSDRIKEIMVRLSLNKNVVDDPLINPYYSDVKTALLIIFSPHRGLAGALPGNLLRFSLDFARNLQNDGYDIKLVTIGQKVRDQLLNQGYQIIADFSDMPEEPTTADVRPIMKLVTDSYLEKEVGKVFVIYPQFVNALIQKPTVKALIPLDFEGLQLAYEADEVARYEGEAEPSYIFEPSTARILQELIPSYMETQIYQTRLETVASEYSARMVAMKNATDNAKELKGDLTIDYNKSRQAQITQELAEINGGRIKG